MTDSGLRKYEIVNPSDRCYLYSDDPRIASVAVALASDGRYGLRDCESGETVLHILMLYDVGEWLAGIGIDPDGLFDFINNNAAKIADVLCSVTYGNGRRTSTFDISRAFERCADSLLEKHGVPEKIIVKCPRCECDDYIRTHYERTSQHTYITGECGQCELRYAQYDGNRKWDRFYPEMGADNGSL